MFKIKNWKKVYFTRKIASITSIILALLIYFINSNVIFIYGYEFESNGTVITQCYTTIPSTIWMEIWNNVHSYLYSFIPFALLVIVNIFLIVDLQQKKKLVRVSDSTIKKNQVSINVSIVVCTILFITSTCPSAIASQYYNILLQTYTGLIVLNVSDCIGFSYHAFSVIILCLSNKHFYRKFKLVFHCKNGTKIQPTGSHNHTNNNKNTSLIKH